MAPSARPTQYNLLRLKQFDRSCIRPDVFAIVARIVLDPKLPIQPGIVAIHSGCKSELATALSAHAISITPGELVLGIDDKGVLYTHCLDATHAAQYATEAQALRRNLLSKIFA